MSAEHPGRPNDDGFGQVEANNPEYWRALNELGKQGRLPESHWPHGGHGKSYCRSVIPDSKNRDKDDFYPTPPIATESLLGVEEFHGGIWEPACGDGAISKVLVANGYKVCSSDLNHYGYGLTGLDFLMESRPMAPNIITNPPFKLALPFAKHALALTTGKVALLLRLQWLEGIERGEFFRSAPLARVWVFSKRVSICRRGEPWRKGGGGMIAFAWFVWDHEHKGPPTLGWI